MVEDRKYVEVVSATNYPELVELINAKFKEAAVWEIVQIDFNHGFFHAIMKYDRT